MNNYFNVVMNASFKYVELSKSEEQIIVNGYNNGVREELFKLSKKKKILPFVGKLMCKLDLDFNFWKEHVSYYEKRNRYILDVLTKVFSSFKNHNVKKVFVYENFGALLASHSDVTLFASGDVDLYADPSERKKIEEALAAVGFYIKRDSYSRELVASAYYCQDLEEEFYVSIMWQPLSRNKLPFVMDIDYCIDWNNLRKYKETDIYTPQPEALMYLCILHISVHGYSRAPDIRLYIDVNNVARLPIDWKTVLEYAEHDKTTIRLLTACIIAQKILGISIPKFVLDQKSNYSSKIDSLLKVVYDEKNNCLRYEPRGIDVLKIESYSDNMNLFTGILNMMFPDPKWIKNYYFEDRGNLLVGYLKHIKHLI